MHFFFRLLETLRSIIRRRQELEHVNQFARTDDPRDDECYNFRHQTTFHFFTSRLISSTNFIIHVSKDHIRDLQRYVARLTVYVQYVQLVILIHRHSETKVPALGTKRLPDCFLKRGMLLRGASCSRHRCSMTTPINVESQFLFWSDFKKNHHLHTFKST